MSNQEPTPPAFNYTQLDPETTNYLKQNAEETRGLLKRTTEDIIQIGQNLLEVKKRLPHGQFTPWLKAELGISQPTAWRFMQVAQGKEIKKKSFTVNDLMGQISAPSQPEEEEKAGESDLGKEASDELSASLSADPQAGAAYVELMKRVPQMPEFHEVTMIIPAMQPHEYAGLVESLRSLGLICPIVTIGGKILDGRMRYLACRDASVLPRFVEYEGDTSKSALIWYVYETNVLRQHLTEDQQAMMALELLEQEK